MVRVPTWDENVSDLPGASKTPHATGESFGEQIGVATQQAGRDIGRGIDTLGSALTSQQDEQDAIKAKVTLSDHETAVNLYHQNLLATTPASEAARIPDMVQQFKNDDWEQRRQGIGGRYQQIADQNAHIYWNQSYVQHQQQAVKQYTDAVTTQVQSEVQRQGMLVFADPNNIHAATGAISAYVNETNLAPEIKRQMLNDAASNLQTQIVAGYQLRIQNALNQQPPNIAEANKLRAEAGAAAANLPGQLTEQLGINRLPKAVVPPVMQPGGAVSPGSAVPGSAAPGTGRRSDATNGRPQAQLASLSTEVPASQATGTNSPIKIAESLLGKHEVANNQVISEFIGRVGGQRVDPARTAWCAGFVNAVLRKSGLPGTDSLAARSFLNYGQATNQPQVGDIVVFSRGPGHGHVGFFAGYGDNGRIKVLGGNQSDRVSIASYGTGNVIGYRHITLPDTKRTQVATKATAPEEAD